MRIILLFFVLFFICVNKAWSVSEKQFSFCYENWRPFVYSNSVGEAEGLHISAIKKALAPLGYQLVFIELPYMRCLKRVQAGEIDFALHVDEMDDILLIDHPIGSWDLLFAYQASSKEKVVGDKNIKIGKVVIARDYNYPQVVLDMLKVKSKQILKRSFYTRNQQDVKNLFRLVENGFVDAILVDKSWALFEMSRQKLAITLSKHVLYSQPQYIGYIKQNSAAAEKIFQALTAHANQ